METVDVLCVGGGVIGLATAFDLAAEGLSVLVVDRGAIGREASWAGAGILPPAYLEYAQSDDDRLRAHSAALFEPLSQVLFDLVGIDIGLRNCGGIQLIEDEHRAEELARDAVLWRQQGIAAERLSARELVAIEPALASVELGGYLVPAMRQVRNPWLLRGLAAGAERRGARLRPDTPVMGFEAAGERLVAARTADGNIAFGQMVLATGAWSGPLAAELGLEIPIRPIRGQMLALEGAEPIVRHIVESGKRYLVPRDDGLTLVGSTEEDVGFDKQTTEEAIGGLGEFARQLFPSLASQRERTRWAGLRPGNALDFPIIGPLPGWQNAYVATGHFRQGLQLAPGTSRLIADWMTGRESFAGRDSFMPGGRRGPFANPFPS